MSTPGISPKPQLNLSTAPILTNKYAHLLYVDTPKRTTLMAQSYSSPSSIHSVCSEHSAASNPSSHTSAHSIQMPTYADEHYSLINTIQPELIPSHIPKDHAAIHCARMMSQIHNMVIRALNSSYNHCLTIEPNTQEAGDFLIFNKQLCATLNHHHHTEDDLFPEIERLLGKPGAMEDNTAGHGKFMGNLRVFEAYVNNTKPSEYNGLTFRHLIEGFAPDLIQHLHDEIPTLTKLYVLDSRELMKVWKVAEHIATKDTDLYTAAPFTLGCQDKSFKVDGKDSEFSGIPWLVEKAVEKWHARRYAGAWRYCPSDLSGKRRLLSSSN